MSNQSVTNIANAIVNKINSLISSHNSNSNAHQNILSDYYNKSETNNYDVDFILGTQTASTSAWTGTTDVISSLREGTTIFYKLPYASTSTSVTLNLTLKGGGTTGTKNVFYKNTTRVTTHYGVGQVVGLTYNGTAWYVISPSDNNSNNDNNYGGIQFKAGEALTTQTICCAKDNGQYYKVANGVVLDIRYPLIMTSSAVASGTTTNAMYRTWYGVNIANTKSMTLTNGSQLFLEGTAYSDGKFTISSNVVTHTLTNGRYYIKVGTALSATQIRFISDMTVYYYNGTTLKPVIKKDQIVDFPTIPNASSVTPSADTTSGSVGNGTTWARSDHIHPKSNLYADSNKLGDIDYFYALIGGPVFDTDSLYNNDVKLWDKLYYSIDNDKLYSRLNGNAYDEIATLHDIPSITGKEDNTNKVTSLSSSSTDTQYPSAKVVYDSLNIKEDKSNKVTSISSSSTDTQYPSAKAVYDTLPIFNILTTLFFQDSDDYDIYLNEDSTQYDENQSVTYDNGELIFTSGRISGSLNYDYSNIFSRTNYYTISFKIKKPSGTYTGKDFGIIIGDEENAMKFFFGFYNIDCRMSNEDEAQNVSGRIVYANEYTNVSITRNENMWTLDYNNGEYICTVTSYNNTVVNKLIVMDMNWGNTGTIYIKDIVVKPKQCIADFVYPIGSIYMSVNNVSPQVLFGGIWEQIQDTFLLASGTTYTNGSTGGSADAVVVKHNHTQNPHNHTQNAHNHTANADGKQSFLTAPTGSSWNEVAGSNISGSGYHYVATQDKSNYNVWVSQSANATATNQAQTATNQESGVDGTGKNMPPYLAVYMWERVG